RGDKDATGEARRERVERAHQARSLGAVEVKDRDLRIAARTLRGDDTRGRTDREVRRSHACASRKVCLKSEEIDDGVESAVENLDVGTAAGVRADDYFGKTAAGDVAGRHVGSTRKFGSICKEISNDHTGDAVEDFY